MAKLLKDYRKWIQIIRPDRNHQIAQSTLSSMECFPGSFAFHGHPDKYASLEMRLRDELSPEGILEEDSVFEILLLLIMRQRAMETMTCIFFRDPLSRELRKCGTSAVDRQKFFEQRAHEEGGKIR